MREMKVMKIEKSMGTWLFRIL